eukprot:TRINITY_DN18294_c0_g1_i1.p1 TRINITY_DN18294_c0_g1~~TRINITY_DN18294_c0_g1_i1.p1  ORF type:complete len:337 (-),score=52.37 TRINITY_DN18294_c0_g1_i1:652-1560(-)
MATESEQLARFARWGVAAGAEDLDLDSFVADEARVPANEEETCVGGEEERQRSLQKFAVLMEYERLQGELPGGVYVVPSLDDSVMCWHGVIHIGRGLYQGGVFRFRLEFPAEYPETAPELRFVVSVFHPLVDPVTGRFDITAFLPEWRSGRDCAASILRHFSHAFFRREYFSSSSRSPLNEEARDLFIDDPATFAVRARECVANNVVLVNDAVAPPFNFSFAAIPTEGESASGVDDSAGEESCGPRAISQQTHCRAILDALHAQEDDADAGSWEYRKETFVDWFCDYYAFDKFHDESPPSQR